MDDNIFGTSKKEAMDYVVNRVTKIIIGITIIVGIVLIMDEGETHTKVHNIWKNADYSKPASAVKSLDYETNTVTYRDYKGFQGEIKIPDVQKINGMSHEELIEKMDLDYSDLVDYYGAEGR